MASGWSACTENVVQLCWLGTWFHRESLLFIYCLGKKKRKKRRRKKLLGYFCLLYIFFLIPVLLWSIWYWPLSLLQDTRYDEPKVYFKLENLVSWLLVFFFTVLISLEVVFPNIYLVGQLVDILILFILFRYHRTFEIGVVGQFSLPWKNIAQVTALWGAQFTCFHWIA